MQDTAPGDLWLQFADGPTAAIMLTSKHAPVDLCNIWAFIQEDILLYTQEGPRRVEEGVNGMLSKYDVTNVHTPSALDVHSALHSVNGARGDSRRLTRNVHVHLHRYV